MTLHLILNGSTGRGCSCLCGVVSIVNVGMPGAGSDDCILVQPYTFLLYAVAAGRVADDRQRDGALCCQSDWVMQVLCYNML